ncbi:MAG: hypothetical protein DCC67_05885 [Planctomycetota bacterium]|nr:MAG: hypothetical protein DCC67_05885 [Planctomycetota bacterium]
MILFRPSCMFAGLAALLSLMKAAHAQPGFRWQERPGESIALCDGDSVIWQFNYGPALAKPLFHPLALADSPPLTVDRPPDHAWHHGLWFSWVFVNGVNYWEHDPQTGRPVGRTQWSDVKIVRNPDYSADISLQLAYGEGDRPPVLRESRTLRVKPRDSAGAYAIDWQCAFTAETEPASVSVRPIPPMPGGVAWGGYGGLSVRLAEGLEDRRASTAEAAALFDAAGIYRGQSPACDYSGVTGGVLAGIALLDHPDNPRHPSPWYAIRSDMSYLNAAIMAPGPIGIPPHETLTLRYRAVVHPGRWDATALTEAARRYAADAAEP